MSAAFDRAWAVLKEDWESLGRGEYRQVSRGPDPGLAYKRPHATLSPTTAPPTFAPDVATGQALAQMGLPFAPETPVLDPETNRPMATQALAPRGSMLDVWNQSGGDERQWREMQNDFFQSMGPELGGGGQVWNENGPLFDAIGLTDVLPKNVGVYEDGPKVIDFETNIGHEDPVGSGDLHWRNRALPWAHVPKEQRREFIDLYGDKTMFDPLQSTSDPAWNQEWSRYLNTIRNLQFFNDLVENPEQRRLFEFDADADPNDARQVGVIRDRLSEMKVPRETV